MTSLFKQTLLSSLCCSLIACGSGGGGESSDDSVEQSANMSSRSNQEAGLNTQEPDLIIPEPNVLPSVPASAVPSITPSPSAVPSVIPTVAPSATPSPVLTIRTSELKSSDSFLFENFERVSIRFELSNSESMPDRMSVCLPESPSNDSETNCLYSGPIQMTNQNLSLFVPNEFDDLELVTWTFTPELSRKVYLWSRSNGPTWYVTL
ncbi:hypothetical protein [Agaribacterium sp. ZY112]|uniref:hypothetical protein n=1 Tax=Agaribacterium sp. ZY112 TaxID=3233574 RepID=UPI003524C294